MSRIWLSRFAAGLLVIGAVAAPIASMKSAERARVVVGKVFNRQNQPIARAIVYLKNTKSLAVKTYITDADGGYRFLGLAPNVDYEVYAEFNGSRSDTKTVSAFDTRELINVMLRIK